MANILRRANVNIYKVLFILFIISIIIGSIFANELDKSRIDEYQLLSGYFITKFPNSTYLNIDLFKFIVLKRIKFILAIWVFGFTFFELIINYIVVIFFGFSFGFLFSVGLISTGFSGYLLYLVLLFPQYLIYVPIIIYLIVKSTNFSLSLYGGRLRSRTKANRQLIIEYFLVIIICIIFISVGSVLETYVNPQLVKWYISVTNL